MREAFDSEILHDLFDLLFEVHHFRLEFRSLFYFARVILEQERHIFVCQLREDLKRKT